MGFPFTSALVTGASSGIGEVMVDQLAAAGVPTVVVARRRERLEALAQRHSGIEVLPADLTDPDDRRSVADRISSTAEPIDLVVNNAGFGTSGLFHEIDPDRLEAEIDLNVAALTRLSHVAITAMVARRRGFVLNVSSIAGLQAAPRLGVYAATKAYVTSFTESVHAEVKPYGVKVSALLPGLTRTEFQRVSNTEHYADDFPSFVWSTADDVARAGLDGVAKGRALIVPGALYKGVAAAAGVTPRSIARRVSGLVQRG